MITLVKAIEELTEITNYTTHRPSSSKVEAIKLGIEALKAWMRLKEGHQFTETSLLPGETED
ncbi:hypothetical protein ES703_98792 [subsurface metagenome]